MKVLKRSASNPAAHDEGSWRLAASSVREKINMPFNARPWIDTHQLTGMPRQPLYEENVMLGWWSWQKIAANRDKKVWVVDVSQNPSRKPWSSKIQTLAKKSLPYIYHLDRVLDDEDFRKPFETQPYGSDMDSSSES